MDSYRVLIADDEPLARARLRLLLREQRDFRVVAEAGDGLQALDALASSRIDVAFLDIRMPLLDGFEVLDSITAEETPHVVFVTAYEAHAVRAFDANATDYLVKPFREDRFHHALQKIRSRAGSGERPATVSAARRELDRYARRLAVRVRTGFELVAIDTVDWISHHRNYAVLHVGAQQHLMRCTLSQLESRLDPSEFVRVHRSALVNVSRISAIATAEDGSLTLTLQDGTILRASRGYRRRVAKLLKLS